MTEWIDGWIKRGWKGSTKKPVLNQDLWEALKKEEESANIDFVVADITKGLPFKDGEVTRIVTDPPWGGFDKTINIEKEQELFMTDFPMMTPHGTFIISGIERVIVPQLARSFGVFFTESETRGIRYFGAKIIPARGVWIEIESESDEGIYIRIDKKSNLFVQRKLFQIFQRQKNLITKTISKNYG